MPQTEVSGLFQWLKFGPAGATVSTGVVDGGDLRLNPQLRERFGIGGQHQRRGGVVDAGGAAQFYITNTNVTLAQAMFRASYPRGALTEMELEGGTDDWAIDYSACPIVQGRIELPENDALRANVVWGSQTPAVGTGSAQIAEGAVGIDDYEFVCSFEAEEYGILSFAIDVNNNATFGRNKDTVAAGSLRLPNYYIYGAEELGVELTTGRPLPIATLGSIADDLATDLGMLFTGIGPSHTAILTLTNLAQSDFGFQWVDNNSQVRWTYRFTGDAQNGSCDFNWAENAA